MRDLFPRRLPPRKRPLSVAGSAVVALGALIVGLCGLCSLGAGYIVVSMTLSQTPPPHDLGAVVRAAFSSLGVVGIFGGVPIAIGLGLIFWGLSMREEAP